MKNLKRFSKYSILSLLAIVLISCSAEDGMDGAVGPQGPAGIDGINGADGEDGNANVMASEWIPSGFSNDPQSFSDGFGVDDPRFTQDVIDSSAILAYGRQDTFIVNLPDTVSGIIYNFTFGIGNIFFEGYNETGSDVVFNRFDSFRYVIIPATVTEKNSHPDFSKMPYEEVMDYFDLDY
ncbi:collagen-like protein [Flagellimonas sp. CMM7]|uniref:collagen-like triple helix repeat-containing protein n=1 Tax=Flagellimonas sp. CMM7 TaxID=2654676 RepID=UPI0013D7C33F|nr:collagen-like protein [Flagellimonas sp. CMM7]UII78406.1 collagen-like protein [Flagellimonas sp. CMM7]